MQKTSYPPGLVPKVEWKTKLQTDVLLKQICDFCVIRRIDGSPETCIDQSLGTPILRSNTLRAKDVINMSVSLLGALFLLEHLEFRQVGAGKDNWNGKKVGNSLLSSDNFQVVEQPFFEVVWSASEIHNQPIPYKKEVTKVSAFNQLKQDVERVSKVVLGEFEVYKATELPLKATTRLNHCPTNLNYWHFTFDTYPADGAKPILKEDAWRKRVLEKAAKDILRISFFRIHDREIPTIPPELWAREECS